MNALICKQPGEFTYEFLEMPEVSKGKSILKVERIGICGTDLHAFEGTQPFFKYPRILGHELALSIVQTDSPDFSVGELVTIIPYFHCGTCIACKNGKTNCCTDIAVFGVHQDGGMREYIQVSNEYIIHGNGLEADELALIEPLAIGAHAVRRAAITPEETVLVIGAGPIGMGVIAFATIAGAHVIVMDINEFRLKKCSEIFEHVICINAKNENAVEKLKQITQNDMPTIVFDATGNLQAINQGFTYMAHGGKYVLVGLQKEAISFSHPEFHKREATLMSSRNATKLDFEQVLNCIQKGKLNPQNFITHRITFNDIVSEFPNLSHPLSQVIKALIYF